MGLWWWWPNSAPDCEVGCSQAAVEGGGGRGRLLLGQGAWDSQVVGSVHPHGLLDPPDVATDFGVDARLGGRITRDVPPGHNAL